MLGSRETHLYGETSLASIEKGLGALAADAGHDLVHFQSNAEHELLQHIQVAASDETAFILFNPAAFTHTSVALRDGLLAAKVPFIEVHLSNPAAREPFRRQSFFSDIAVGIIAGFGADSYEMAFSAAVRYLADSGKQKR